MSLKNMAAETDSSRIVKVGDGREMRKVEEDVLVPKIMKKHAMERCSEHVKGLQKKLKLMIGFTEEHLS